MNSEKKRFRIQFEFDESAYERLHRLKHKAEAHTLAEVVRRATRSYEQLLKLFDTMEKENLRLALINEDGEVISRIESLSL